MLRMALIPPIVLAAFWFGFEKAKMIWIHVDSETPVSAQEATTGELSEKLDETKRVNEDVLEKVATAIEELDRQRKEIKRTPVRGQVSRDLNESPGTPKVLFLNSNSDARRFRNERELELSYRGTSIRVEVGGTITNPDDRVIGKLNAQAAESLGISKRDGVADVTLRLGLEDSD